MEATPDGSESHREEVLSDRNDRLRDLIRSISHDLRTPLAVAKGNVELARETGDLSRLDSAEQALARATELLDHLALLAKEGEGIHEPDPTELGSVAEAAWSVVGREEATLSAEVDLVVSADRQRLQQLFENLFDNALTHAGSDVTVTVGSLEGERAGFFVGDDGPGIPEDELTAVFETGYSDDAGGKGFGLAICERIAVAHGWTIGAVERADGGARFEVSDVEVVGR
jgi:signal transduction histidine kinase